MHRAAFTRLALLAALVCASGCDELAATLGPIVDAAASDAPAGPRATAGAQAAAGAVPAAPRLLAAVSPPPIADRKPVAGCAPLPAGLDRDDYEARFDEAEDAGDWAEAACVMRAGTRAHPGDAQLHGWLAYAAAKHGAYAEAAAGAERALALGGDAGVRARVAGAYGAMGGQLAWDQGRWQAGAYWMARGLAVDADDAGAWFMLGITCANAGGVAYHEQAAEAWQAAYDLDPGKVTGDTNGNMLVSVRAGLPALRGARKLEAAIAYAELARRALPAHDAEWVTALVDLYAAAGRRAQLAALIAEMPEGPGKRVAEGIRRFSDGDEAGAAETFLAASQAAPDDFELDRRVASFYRGRIAGSTYGDQMGSPYQDAALAADTRAVRKYFRLRPYEQRRTFTPPLAGDFCVGQGAGGKSYHYGIGGHYTYDLVGCGKSADGMPIHAIAGGTVVQAIYEHPDRPDGTPVDLAARANVVEIDHGDGLTSTYVHLRHASGTLAKGDRVAAGQVIGLVGNTGVSTGPHLHFQLNRQDPDHKVPVPVRLSGLRRDGPDGPVAETLSEEPRHERFFGVVPD